MKKIVIGLTGNMGAGKTTAVSLLKEENLPVFECDTVVHTLMQNNEEMKKLFMEKFPQSIQNNQINRAFLSALIQENKLEVTELEKIIYPFLEKELENFFKKYNKDELLILDVPLLFEAKWERFCDKIIVLTAPEEILKARVFMRQGMTEEKYKILTHRQLSQKDKCLKADYILETQFGIEPVRQGLHKIIKELK